MACEICVLADQDVEDDAVDAVVLAVEGDGADDVAPLAEPVDAAFALLVPGGVPGQVVVDDGVEVLLEVDALGQAVGRDQDVPARLGRSSSAMRSLPLGGRERAGDARDTRLPAELPSRCSATYSAVGMNGRRRSGGSRRRAALNLLMSSGELLVRARPSRAVGLGVGQRQQAAPGACVVGSVVVVGAGVVSMPSSVSSSAMSGRCDGRGRRPPRRWSAASGWRRVRRVAAAARGRGGQGAEQRERRPPAHPLPRGVPTALVCATVSLA